VHYQRLAEGAEHHVRWLEVAVQHPPAVRVGYRVADVEEPLQEPPQLQGAGAGTIVGARRLRAVDGRLQALAADQPHGIIRTAVAVHPQSVDGHDAGVLEPAGDLGLPEEAGTALRVVGVGGADLLEGDLAIELGIPRNEDLAEAAARVRPEDTEPAGPIGL